MLFPNHLWLTIIAAAGLLLAGCTGDLAATAPLCTPTLIPVLWTLPGRVIPEPFGVNIHFAQPDPLSYARLATETIAAIRRVDPPALIVGPATAGFP